MNITFQDLLEHSEEDNRYVLGLKDSLVEEMRNFQEANTEYDKMYSQSTMFKISNILMDIITRRQNYENV
jgi:hypothetical protein